MDDSPQDYKLFVNRKSRKKRFHSIQICQINRMQNIMFRIDTWRHYMETKQRRYISWCLYLVQIPLSQVVLDFEWSQLYSSKWLHNPNPQTTLAVNSYPTIWVFIQLYIKTEIECIVPTSKINELTLSIRLGYETFHKQIDCCYTRIIS